MDNLVTQRLLLRRWRESDRLPFRALNADPRVMEFFPSPLRPEETDQLIENIEQHFQKHGFGLFAAELRDTQAFLGFMGLAIPGFAAPFLPAVEIGWRLAAEYWGQGLATEGAWEVLRYGFEVLGLTSIVSFTVPANVRSRRVMEKLRMIHDVKEDFEHPRLPEGHPLRHHVVYRLDRGAWRKNQGLPL